MIILKRLNLLVGLITLICAAQGFGQNSNRTAYGILLDNTGTLRPDLDNVKKAGKAVLKHLNSPPDISIFNFATQEVKKKQIAGPVLGVNWGNDLPTLNRHIDGLSTQVGQTTLFDAIQFLAERIKEQPGSSKTLILVTDGQDRVSEVKKDDLIVYLKSNNIKVFVIGFVEGLSSDFFAPGTQKKAKNFLTKITEETGGRVIFPKEKQAVDVVIKNLFAAK